jgi:hypothetical protein
MATVKSTAKLRLMSASGSLWEYEDLVAYTNGAGELETIRYRSYLELDANDAVVQVLEPGQKMDPVFERFRDASVLNDPPVAPEFVWSAKPPKDGVTLWEVKLVWTVKGQSVTLRVSWALTSLVGQLTRLNASTELEAEGALATEADRLRREEASRLSTKP